MTPTLIACRAGGVWLGIAPGHAAVSHPLPAFAPLPNGPGWLLGIAWSQGDPIGVVDLARLAERGATQQGLALRLTGTAVALAVEALVHVAPTGPAPEIPVFAPWTGTPLRFEDGIVHPIRFDALMARIERGR